MTFNESPAAMILQSACKHAESKERPLDSHPLWCDLSVLPELDISPHNHFMSKLQPFNPCGIDTVLLLEETQPSTGYLMSLINCFALVEETKIAVVPFPSTFFFETNGRQIKYDERQISAAESAIRLEVVFDMTAVGTLLLHHKAQQKVGNRSFFHPQSSPPSCDQQEEPILRILQSIAEQEARDLDRLLCALGAIILILISIYGWTVWSILKRRHNKKGRSTERSSNQPDFLVHDPPHPASIGYPFITDLVDERRSMKNGAPPVESVVFDRKCVDCPSLIAEPLNRSDQPRLEQPTTTAAMRFIKQESPKPNLALTNEPPKLFNIENKAPTPRFCFSTGDQARALSPCSRLAREWEAKKSTRRSKRRTGTAASHPLVPIVPPHPKARKKSIIPVMDDSKKEDVPLCPTSASETSFLNDYW